jgi:Fe-S-cluster containining protein
MRLSITRPPPGQHRSRSSIKSPINFLCRECGRCCTAFYINVTDADISRIAGETGRRPEDFVDLCPRGSIIDRDEDCDLKMRDGTYRIILAETRGRCIFQLPDRRCAIYVSRPLPCRLFPFDLREGGVVVNEDARGVCGGLSSKGRPVDEGMILSLECQWSQEVNQFAGRIREWNGLFDQGKVDGTRKALLSYLFAAP